MLSTGPIFPDDFVIHSNIRIAVVVRYLWYFVSYEVSFRALALVYAVPLVSYRDDLLASRFDADDIRGIVDPQREWQIWVFFLRRPKRP